MSKHILKKLLYCIILSINLLSAYAEENELKYILSLDTGFTMTALRNCGLGLGMNYEHKLTDFLSIKPGIGSMICFSDMTFSNMTVITVGITLFMYYYPLSDGLDKLYVGIGNSTDFLMYQNDIPQDTVISIIPVLGWKWKALPYLMVEPFIGWKFYINKTDNYKNFDKYANGGFQWGLSLKLFLKNRE
jgi:hypothetical protein